MRKVIKQRPHFNQNNQKNTTFLLFTAPEPIVTAQND